MYKHPAAPVFQDISPSYLVHKTGDTVDLYCSASATPDPTLTWIKDGRPLSERDNV